MSKEGLKAIAVLFMWLGLCVLGLYLGMDVLGVKTVALWRFFAGWFLLVFAWLSLIIAMKVIIDD